MADMRRKAAVRLAGERELSCGPVADGQLVVRGDR